MTLTGATQHRPTGLMQNSNPSNCLLRIQNQLAKIVSGDFYTISINECYMSKHVTRDEINGRFIPKI